MYMSLSICCSIVARVAVMRSDHVRRRQLVLSVDDLQSPLYCEQQKDRSFVITILRTPTRLIDVKTYLHLFLIHGTFVTF